MTTYRRGFAASSQPAPRQSTLESDARTFLAFSNQAIQQLEHRRSKTQARLDGVKEAISLSERNIRQLNASVNEKKFTLNELEANIKKYYVWATQEPAPPNVENRILLDKVTTKIDEYRTNTVVRDLEEELTRLIQLRETEQTLMNYDTTTPQESSSAALTSDVLESVRKDLSQRVLAREQQILDANSKINFMTQELVSTVNLNPPEDDVSLLRLNITNLKQIYTNVMDLLVERNEVYKDPTQRLLDREVSLRALYDQQENLLTETLRKLESFIVEDRETMSTVRDAIANNKQLGGTTSSSKQATLKATTSRMLTVDSNIQTLREVIGSYTERQAHNDAELFDLTKNLETLKLEAQQQESRQQRLISSMTANGQRLSELIAELKRERNDLSVIVKESQSSFKRSRVLITKKNESSDKTLRLQGEAQVLRTHAASLARVKELNDRIASGTIRYDTKPPQIISADVSNYDKAEFELLKHIAKNVDGMQSEGEDFDRTRTRARQMVSNLRANFSDTHDERITSIDKSIETLFTIVSAYHRLSENSNVSEPSNNPEMEELRRAYEELMVEHQAYLKRPVEVEDDAEDRFSEREKEIREQMQRNLTTQIDRLTQQYAQTENSLRSNIESLRRGNRSLESKRAELSQANINWARRHTNLEQSVTALTKKIEVLKRSNTDKALETATRIRQLENELRQKTSSIEDLDVQLKQINSVKTIDDLQRHLTERIESLERTLSEKEVEAQQTALELERLRTAQKSSAVVSTLAETSTLPLPPASVSLDLEQSYISTIRELEDNLYESNTQNESLRRDIQRNQSEVLELIAQKDALTQSLGEVPKSTVSLEFLENERRLRKDELVNYANTLAGIIWSPGNYYPEGEFNLEPIIQQTKEYVYAQDQKARDQVSSYQGELAILRRQLQKQQDVNLRGLQTAKSLKVQLQEYARSEESHSNDLSKLQAELREVGELARRVEVLTSEVNHEKSLVHQKDEQIKILQADLEQYRKQTESMTKRELEYRQIIKNEAARYAKATANTKELESQVQQWKSQFDEKDKLLRETFEKVNSQEFTLQQLLERSTQVETDRQSLKTLNQTLEEQVQRLIGKNTEITEEKLRIQEVSSQQASRLIELAENLRQATARNTGNIQEVADLRAQFEKERDEWDKSLQEANELSIQQATLFETIRVERSILSAERDELATRVDTIETAKKSIELARDQLAKTLDAQRQAFSDRIDELQTSNAKSNEENQGALAAVKQFLSVENSKNQVLTNVNIELKRSLKILEQTNGVLNGEFNELRRSAEEQAKKIDEDTGKIERLQNLLLIQRQAYKGVSKELAEVKGNYAKSRSKLTNALKKVRVAEQEVEQQRTNVEKLQKELDAAQAELNRTRTATTALNEEISRLADTNKQLSTNLVNLQAELKEVQTSEAELKRKIARIEEELIEETELADQYKNLAEELHDEVKKLRTKGAQTMIEENETIDRMEQEEDELAKQTEILQDTYDREPDNLARETFQSKTEFRRQAEQHLRIAAPRILTDDVLESAVPTQRFDITAEQANYANIVAALDIADGSRVFDHVENYISKSGAFDQSVFVMMDAFHSFSMLVAGFSAQKDKNAFWQTHVPGRKALIEDIVEAGTEDTATVPAIDVKDFPNLRPLLENTLNAIIDERLSTNRPGSLPSTLIIPRATLASHDDVAEVYNGTRSLISASSNDVQPAKIFSNDGVVQETYDFREVLQAYILPALNQQEHNVVFSLSSPTQYDPWTRIPKGTTRVVTVKTLSYNIMRHLHISRSGDRVIRRPTTLSAKKLLADLLLRRTLSDAAFAGQRYTEINARIEKLLEKVVDATFYSAFRLSLEKFNIPMNFKSNELYGALNSIEFAQLVGSFYAYNVARRSLKTKGSRESLSILGATISTHLETIKRGGGTIPSMEIPTPGAVFVDNGSTSFISYIDKRQRDAEEEDERKFRTSKRSRTPYDGLAF